MNKLMSQFFELNIKVQHSVIRLQGQTDAEALHDLRVSLRKLRSLIRPFRDVDPMQQLDEAASALARITSPARDLEVMIAVLRKEGFTEQVAPRIERVRQQYAIILASEPLQLFLTRLDQWPQAVRLSERGGALKGARRTVTKYLKKQAEELRQALDDKGFDRHELRVLVKKLRYAIDAYPALSPLPKKTLSSLKNAQACLGKWHDLYQWKLRAEAEPDLAVLHDKWQQQAQAALARAERELIVLDTQLG